MSFRTFGKWLLRTVYVLALVGFMASTYLYWSYLEWAKERDIPFIVDHKSGTIYFKLPWHWGTEDMGMVEGLCKDPTKRSM
jgi:hypothetical protein